MNKLTDKDLEELYDSIPSEIPLASHAVLAEVRAEFERLINLKYPTREDMRKCMWLGKEIIDKLLSEHFS